MFRLLVWLFLVKLARIRSFPRISGRHQPLESGHRLTSGMGLFLAQTGLWCFSRLRQREALMKLQHDRKDQ